MFVFVILNFYSVMLLIHIISIWVSSYLCKSLSYDLFMLTVRLFFITIMPVRKYGDFFREVAISGCLGMWRGLMSRSFARILVIAGAVLMQIIVNLLGYLSKFSKTFPSHLFFSYSHSSNSRKLCPNPAPKWTGTSSGQHWLTYLWVIAWRGWEYPHWHSHIRWKIPFFENCWKSQWDAVTGLLWNSILGFLSSVLFTHIQDSRCRTVSPML